MKSIKNEIRYIDEKILSGVLLRPADRKLVEETFFEVLIAAQGFLVEYTSDEPLEEKQIDLEDLFIDRQRGEIEATVSIRLRCKFKSEGKQVLIAEVDFRD